MFLDRFSYNVSIETEAEACFGIAHHRRWRRIWTTNLRPPRVRWVLPRLCSGAEFPMIWMGNSSINEGMSIAIFDYLRARLSIARVFILLPETCWKRSQSHSQNLCTIYPLVIEHSHGKWPIYRWFTYWKWWFFMAMLNNQRVCIYIYFHSSLLWHAPAPAWYVLLARHLFVVHEHFAHPKQQLTGAVGPIGIASKRGGSMSQINLSKWFVQPWLDCGRLSGFNISIRYENCNDPSDRWGI